MRDEATSFLAAGVGLAADQNGLESVVVPTSSAIPISAFGPDRSVPLYQGCSLDLSSGTLSLSFDETVDASQVISSRIGFIDSSIASTRTFTEMVNTTIIITIIIMVKEVSHYLVEPFFNEIKVK